MLCWSERCVAHCLLRALVGCASLGTTARADGFHHQCSYFLHIQIFRLQVSAIPSPLQLRYDYMHVVVLVFSLVTNYPIRVAYATGGH